MFSPGLAIEEYVLGICGIFHPSQHVLVASTCIYSLGVGKSDLYVLRYLQCSHKERTGKGHCSLIVYTCGFERASVLDEAPSNLVWCCTYANGGCGLIANPLECTPGSQIPE